MPRSRESVIAELDAKKIGYVDDMSYKELCELLPVEKPVVAEEPIDYSGIHVGQSTIEGIHTRVTILERQMGKLLKDV